MVNKSEIPLMFKHTKYILDQGVTGKFVSMPPIEYGSDGLIFY